MELSVVEYVVCTVQWKGVGGSFVDFGLENHDCRDTVVVMCSVSVWVLLICVLRRFVR